MTRAEWLASLGPGSRAILQTAVGRYPVMVRTIDDRPDRTDKHRAWLRILKPDSSLALWDCWVPVETGELKSQGLRIEPDETLACADEYKQACDSCARA